MIFSKKIMRIFKWSNELSFSSIKLTSYIYEQCVLVVRFTSTVKSAQIRSFFWSVFSRIRIEYLFVLIPNAGKYGPEKTPYLDNFHAVQPHKQDSYKYMLQRWNNADKGSGLQLFRTPTADRNISLGGIKRNYQLLMQKTKHLNHWKKEDLNFLLLEKDLHLLQTQLAIFFGGIFANLAAK